MKTLFANSCVTLCALLLALPATAAPKRNEKVYAAVQANRDGFLSLWRDIVNIDSGTGDVAGGAKVTALLAGRLKELGADIRSEPAEAPGLPDNLVAVFHGNGKGRILVIAHVDTVFGPGTVAQRPFSLDGDRAHGPGVGDEKDGVVNAVIWPRIFEIFRREVMGARLMLVEGKVQRSEDNVVHLVAERIFDRSPELHRLSEEEQNTPSWRSQASSLHRHPRNVRTVPKSRDFH